MDNSPTTLDPIDPSAIWSQFMSGFNVNSGEKLSDGDRLNLFTKLATNSQMHTLVPLCPLLLNLEGKPYSLIDHFPFEPIFSTHMPRKLVLRAGRQLSKTTSIAASGVLLSAILRFRTLYVTPLYEQIRRFSNNYVRPFIMESPIKSILIGPNTENSVLQRSFKNGSVMFMGYAGLSADRCRGIPADEVLFDETQDIDPDHISVISESMSHSKYAVTRFTGTPKTRDGLLDVLWDTSSMAEWIMRCEACNFENVPAMDYHLEKMIGPWREDISDWAPGIVCAKCRRPINPRLGRWIHRHPERKTIFEGYHIPQIILPIHYASPEKWSVLLSKQKTLAANTFLNEVLGESCDVATKLVSKTDLEKAGCLNENKAEIAVHRVNMYIRRILAIDWGGGGEKGVSYTKMAVIGYTPNGQIEVIHGVQSMTPHDHVREAVLARDLFQKFHCHMLAHDYTGAGNLRETVLVQTGMTPNRLMPIELVRTAAHALFQYIPASDQHPRSRWRLDKARSLQLTCYAIKFGLVKFFRYDYESAEMPGLLHDFLSLVENKVSTAHGSDIYTIQRHPLLSDDFAQAVNLGCAAMWHMHSSWPNFSGVGTSQQMSAQDAAAIGPIDSDPWQDEDMGGYLR